MLSNIKDFIQEVKETIEWVLAGCPKPVKIPIRIKDDNSKQGKTTRFQN